MRYTIEKGDEFLCVKTFKMDTGEIAYKKGEVYISNEKGCLTDIQLYVHHIMQIQPKEFFKYFKLNLHSK